VLIADEIHGGPPVGLGRLRQARGDLQAALRRRGAGSV